MAQNVLLNPLSQPQALWYWGEEITASLVAQEKERQDRKKHIAQYLTAFYKAISYQQISSFRLLNGPNRKAACCRNRAGVSLVMV